MGKVLYSNEDSRMIALERMRWPRLSVITRLISDEMVYECLI